MRVIEVKRAGKLIDKLVSRGASDTARMEPVVRKIVADVRKKGDKALRRYAEKFDGLAKGADFRVDVESQRRALASIAPDLRQALELAVRNIRQFCEWQRPQDWIREQTPGVRLGQIVRPLDSVGCYVPGGRYPLPSTLLMTVIPAQVAGVKRSVVVSPRPGIEILAAAALLGVTEFYAIGGAHAIAALAYGTSSISKVDKIVGPGNLFVTTAKKLVAFDCSIDMLAGPTEALVYNDAGDPRFVAADLVAQAEHDPDAVVILVTCSKKQAVAVASEVKRQSAGNSIARESLKRSGLALIAASREEALCIVNRIGAEHVTIAEADVEAITCAGSIFVGDHSPQPLGDYASGPNHVLPTGNTARFRGGLSVSDFVKVITVQQVSRKALEQLAKTVTTLAEAEGLHAHANAVRMRFANV